MSYASTPLSAKLTDEVLEQLALIGAHKEAKKVTARCFAETYGSYVAFDSLTPPIERWRFFNGTAPAFTA